MATQFDIIKDSPDYQDLKQGHDWGFKIFRNLVEVNHTALDVSDAYYYAKEKGYLTKDDQANYNNRWLQFKGEFHPTSEKIAKYMKKRYKFRQQHIYANWIRDGHNYGRHNDQMDVLILQIWNEVAYTVESENQHNSFTMSPGDAIYIRNGVHHTPIILGERMTMSFSWG